MSDQTYTPNQVNELKAYPQKLIDINGDESVFAPGIVQLGPDGSAIPTSAVSLGSIRLIASAANKTSVLNLFDRSGKIISSQTITVDDSAEAAEDVDWSVGWDAEYVGAQIVSADATIYWLPTDGDPEVTSSNGYPFAAGGWLGIVPEWVKEQSPVSVAIDQSTTNNNVDATLQAAEAHVGEVGWNGTWVSVEFTRPADTTAYSIGDVVSNSTVTTTPMQFANVGRVTGGNFVVEAARVITDKKSITPRLRVHLWRDSDMTLAVDNASHKELYTEIAKKIGAIDLPPMVTPQDSTNSTLSRAADAATFVRSKLKAGEDDLWCTLETLDAFTPASGQKFTVELFIRNA